MFTPQRFVYKVAKMYKINLSRCPIWQIGTAQGALFEQKVARNFPSSLRKALIRAGNGRIALKIQEFFAVIRDCGIAAGSGEDGDWGGGRMESQVFRHGG
jgi:hypothetical protein